MTPEERTAALKDLADLIVFLGANPTVPVPHYHVFNCYVETREELTAVARVGKWDKDYTSNSYFTLRLKFGTNRLDVYTDRAKVCRKVVVGERVVPAVPAMEAQPERVEPVEEWVCEESLLNESRRVDEIANALDRDGIF